MIFGPIKGFQPDRSWQHALITACWLAAMFCWTGYFDGYLTRTEGGELQLQPFAWRTSAVLYTAAMWLAWAIGIWTTGYYQEPQSRWGARFFLSLPVGVFVLLASGMVELDVPAGLEREPPLRLKIIPQRLPTP